MYDERYSTVTATASIDVGKKKAYSRGFIVMLSLHIKSPSGTKKKKTTPRFPAEYRSL